MSKPSDSTAVSSTAVSKTASPRAVHPGSGPKRVAIMTLPGFNEIDSFVAARIIGQLDELSVKLVGPVHRPVSKSGIEVSASGTLEDLASFDAVLFGSGSETSAYANNSEFMDKLAAGLHPGQIVGSQCSGALLLHRLGLLNGQPVCTDRFSAPVLESEGVQISSQAFRTEANMASAGGCLAAAYLAFWVIDRLVGRDQAVVALDAVSPVGEERDVVARAIALVDAV